MPAPVTSRKFLLLILFSASVVLYSQAQDTLQTDSLLLHERYSSVYRKTTEVIPLPYGMETSEAISPLPVAYLQAEDFNQGNIQDPMHLLQGRVAGLTIARAGNDPNQSFDVRLRGISALNGPRSPLIVVDGFPAADLLSIDPQDIASVTVLRGSAATAIYGLRGLPGVIQIETRQGEAGKPVIRYQGSVSTELLSRQAEMADVPTFLELGGENLGHRTDWVDEITRTGLAHIHSLSLSGGNGGTTYRASGHYRNASGILRGSGFQRFNGRASIQQTALDDRLKVSATVSTTSQDSDLGFPEAFRYAHIFNPTAPVFDPATVDYGGYFETGKVEVFNPLSITEQAVREAEQTVWATNLHAEFEVARGLSLSGRYAVQQSNRTLGEAYQKTAWYRGFFENGFAAKSTQSQRSALTEALLRYERRVWQGSGLQIIAGYSRQYLRGDGILIEGGDFAEDEVDYNNLSESIDFFQGLGEVRSFAGETALEAGFAMVHLTVKKPLAIYGALRYERLPLFDRENDWNAFPSVGASYNFEGLFWKSKNIDALSLRASYGLTGGTPSGTPLITVPNGGYSVAPSPLRPERGETFDLGMHFSIYRRRLVGSINAYRSVTSNFLDFVYANAPVLSVRGNFWERDARFVTQGTEVTLEWEAKQSGAIRWQMAVVAATGRTKLENGLNLATKAGYLGPPLTFGLSYQEPIRFQSGALMGQIWGPVYAGVDDDGEYIFEDQNGDGSFMNEEEDFAGLGNAQPSFTLGLGNTFQWGRFDVQVFFRGVFGHDLLNATRASYGSGAVTNLYNVAVGEPFNRFLKERPIINSQHVESASFLSLDNLTLSYRPGLRRADGRLDDQALRVFLNTQNLFTLTRYTGVDPEVRYGPLRSTGFGRHYSDENILSWGIDWRNTYLPARTFTFGVELTL